MKIKTLIKNRLAISSFGTLGIKVSSTALGFVASVLMARILGAEGYGIYSLVMPAVTILAIFALWGSPTFLVRFISEYEIDHKFDLAKGLIISTKLLVLSLAVILASAFAFIGYYFYSSNESILNTIYAAALLLPFWVLLGTSSAVIRALNFSVISQVPEFVLRPTVFLMLLILAYLFSGSFGFQPYHVILFQFFALVLATMIALVVMLRKIPGSVKKAATHYELKLWFYTGLPLVLAAGMEIINQKLSLFVLGYEKNASRAGLFQAALNFSILVSFGMASINMVLAPVLARKFSMNDKVGLQRLATNTSRAMLFFSLPVAIILYYFGEDVLGRVYGDEFIAAYAALVILLIAEVINAGMGSPGLMLRMAGFEKDAAKGMALALLINLILSILLIPPFGLEGAAVAAGTSTIVLKLINAILIKRRSGIRSWALG